MFCISTILAGVNATRTTGMYDTLPAILILESNILHIYPLGRQKCNLPNITVRQLAYPTYLPIWEAMFCIRVTWTFYSSLICKTWHVKNKNSRAWKLSQITYISNLTFHSLNLSHSTSPCLLFVTYFTDAIV